MKHLFIGGNRSGKSQLAEAALLAWQQDNPNGVVIYVATANMQTAAASDDQTMQQRVQQHQTRRPQDWQLIEEPLALADLVNQSAIKPLPTQTCLMIDCLTLWLTNVMLQEGVVDAQRAGHAAQAIDKLSQAIAHYTGDLVIVSNEVGNGIVPMGAINREFADLSGSMNQQVAAVCDQVTLAVVGLPMQLK